MKNKILDESFHDTFRDYLTKDEKVLWRGNSISFRDSLYVKNEDGTYSYSLKKLFTKVIENAIDFMIAIGVLLAQVIFFIFLEHKDSNFFLLVLLIVLLNYIYKLYKTLSKTNQYAITSKRILFQFARLPKEIHAIPFTDIKNCIVTLDEDNHGVLFLATKNPKDLSDKLFEQDRHSPTLEQIENPNQVAQILRQAIRDNSI